MLSYLAYQTKQISYRRLLLLWGLVGVVITHSSFGDASSFLYFPLIPQIGNWLYFTAVVGGFSLLVARNWDELDLRVDIYTILALLYIACAPLSVLVNGTAGIDSRLDMILIPGITGLVLTRVLNGNDVGSLIRLMVIFGVINILLSLVLIVKDQSIGLNSGASVLFTDRNGFVRYMSIINCFCAVHFIDRVKRERCFDARSALLASLLVLILIGSALQFSRSGYIVYFLSAGVVLWFSQSRAIRKAAMILLPVLLATFSFLTFLRVAADNMRVFNYSDVQRLALLKAGWNMIQSHPWFGVGYHISMYRFMEFTDKAFPVDSTITSIHNWYVNVWAEQGVLALVIFLCLNVGMMLEHFRIFTQTSYSDGKMSLFCFTALLILMVDGLFLPNYDYESIYWIVVAVSIITLKGARGLNLRTGGEQLERGIRTVATRS